MVTLSCYLVTEMMSLNKDQGCGSEVTLAAWHTSSCMCLSKGLQTLSLHFTLQLIVHSIVIVTQILA